MAQGLTDEVSAQDQRWGCVIDHWVVDRAAQVGQGPQQAVLPSATTISHARLRSRWRPQLPCERLWGSCMCRPSGWGAVRRTVLLADHSHWPGHGQERAAATDSSSAWPCPKTRTQATAPSWVTFMDARRHTEVHQPPARPEQASSSPCAWTLTLAPTAPSYSWFTDGLHNGEITPSTTVSYSYVGEVSHEVPLAIFSQTAQAHLQLRSTNSSNAEELLQHCAGPAAPSLS